jgi:uncharacterized LabA/DUF88 family protein
MNIKIEQSCAILVDGNNIERSVHNLTDKPNVMLDFDKLVPKLLKDRGLNRLIYFREGKNVSSKLADRLHENFHGRVVPCHKSADIPLTIFATQIAEKVDTIIILSGDSDYVELVRYLRSRGVRVEIAAVKETTAKILKEEADYFTALTIDDLFIFKRPYTKRATKPKPNPRKNDGNSKENNDQTKVSDTDETQQSVPSNVD